MKDELDKIDSDKGLTFNTVSCMPHALDADETVAPRQVVAPARK